MYLRYREPVWETTQLGPRRGAPGTASPRRRDRVPFRSESVGRLTPPPKTLPVIELNGVKLHAVTEAQVIDHILAELDAGRGGVVVTPNLDHLRRYCHDLSFGALVAEADLIVADGMPLVWASRLQGTPLPERVPGSALISTLTAAAGKRERSVFLLGGDPGTADGAALALKQQYPSVIIAGTYFPPFGFQDDPKQMSRIIQALSDAKPDIVYVALGSPKQEKLVAKLRSILPNAWWIGVGNSFSFLAGRVRRAPIWMQRIGMEWAHRLCQEPKRLFRRYLIVGIPFATSLLARSAARGAKRRLRRMLPNPQRATHKGTSQPQFKSVEAPVAAPATSAAPLRPARVETPSIITTDTAMPPRALAGLRAIILLGGSVRANELSSGTGRSVLDLPLDEKGTILTHWLAHAHEVTRWAALARLPVRVMVSQNAPEPLSADSRHYSEFRIERDLSEYRGTGGVLHDIATEYDDDDLLLIGNAAQVLLDPLPQIAAELHAKKADVAVVSHEDGTPSGLMLVRCRALRLIAPRGFVDMKEQALPLIASSYQVRVMQCRRPTGLPVRSLGDYIQALRFHHRRLSGRLATIDPLAEDWDPTFSLIEPGASVDPSARLHDSVVLGDARVEAGAVVVRSIIAPGAVLGSDRTAVDQIVTDEPREIKMPRGRRLAAAR
jgi:N-acetylglucosaminyldiphosphoundecaprenol N-acetyl-beta-D-mannosaminyltransferase